MSIWASCHGEKQVKPLKKTAWRVVEDQHISTTRKLVDSVAEHEILESLIENSKPFVDENAKKEFHYLLFTPFRYPPLKYGSRFGSINEISLWYGSLELDTAFAEVAYYRLVFLYDTAADLGYINVLLTAYSVNILTKQGVDLTALPFKKYRDKISSPTTYEHSQLLGKAMRENKVNAFLYFSARTNSDGINMSVYNLTAFSDKNPTQEIKWECIANKNGVEFNRKSVLEMEKKSFSIDQFEINNKLPIPSTYTPTRENS